MDSDRGEAAMTLLRKSTHWLDPTRTKNGSSMQTLKVLSIRHHDTPVKNPFLANGFLANGFLANGFQLTDS